MPARLERLNALRQAVMSLRERYAALGVTLDAERVYGWSLAVYEAATNVVCHAAQPGRDNALTLVIEPLGEQVRFRLLDQGPPLAALPSAALPSPLDERGYGLYLIHRLVDQVRYQRRDAGNELSLICKLGLDIGSHTP